MDSGDNVTCNDIQSFLAPDFPVFTQSNNTHSDTRYFRDFQGVHGTQRWSGGLGT